MPTLGKYLDYFRSELHTKKALEPAKRPSKIHIFFAYSAAVMSLPKYFSEMRLSSPSARSSSIA